ncbi:IS3 family transposase [Erysipelothrix rhusiopathiae]|uniref:IS3 family transposase n=1 Tax=Erysipelothrix rhusiopathiae TaxID=1648 RepID=UPI003F470560
MGTRTLHSYETKMKVIEMKLSGYSSRFIQTELGIKNVAQVKIWWRWYRNGEHYRFSQPVGKQYTFGKGPERDTVEETQSLRIKSLEQQIELLKKGFGKRKDVVPEIIIKLVEEYRNTVSIKDILNLFGVPKSTYYRWTKKEQLESNNYSVNEALVIELCKENKFRYGYRKITALIRKERIINKNTVQKIMQKHQCQCRVKVKRYRKNKNPKIIMPNIINRDFKSLRPLEKLVTDITYIPYGHKMLYLSTIMDLYNGEIIASTLSDRQNLECVVDTLNQFPDIVQPCILHSDQGSVYTSKEYQLRVKNKSITMSMSRKGTPADNAPIESFHSSLKCETFELNPELKGSTKIVSQTVINYFKYYNENRIQEKLGYQSPVNYLSVDLVLTWFFL